MVEQNTTEWLEMRKSKIGASDAPIIMGDSPYCTVYQLWEEKLGIKERAFHAGFKYGHEMEPVARGYLERELMCSMLPKVLVHPKYSWMMASIDALNENLKIAAEIKNPNEADHLYAKSGFVPRKYFAQLQHQLEILHAIYGIDQMYYFSHRNGDTATITVQREESYIKDMIEREHKFWINMTNFIPPRVSTKDYVTLSDKESVECAAELSKVMSEINALKEREKELRSKLIEKAGKQNCLCGDLKITRYIAKGSIDYSAIDKLSDINLEDYRKESKEYWRIASA